MLDVNKIIESQAKNIVDWHAGLSLSDIEPPFIFIQENNYWNYQLWHQEDIARRNDIEPAEMILYKRSIDRYNQQRNDAMEKIDEWIAYFLVPKSHSSVNKMHSETPGMMIDRLSIMSLKKYHMDEEAVRKNASPEHRQKCSEMVLLLNLQIQDLSRCLSDVLLQLERGELQFRVYRQLKMYNNPDLNPQLYQQVNSGNQNGK